jgi:hypothetical protein
MLPKALYDALPWLYMGIGALVGAGLESQFKYMPATVLMLAGVLVLIWRSRSTASSVHHIIEHEPGPAPNVLRASAHARPKSAQPRKTPKHSDPDSKWFH